VSDVVEPPVVQPAQPSTTRLGISPFSPSSALLKASIPDGVYVFRVDPDNDETLRMGTSLLVLPANSICRLGKSGYGPDYWNQPCDTEKKSLTITVVSSGSNTKHPRVDFTPELRFNPKKTVTLYMYGKGLTKEDATNSVMYYCGSHSCVNEALKDPSLTSYVDTRVSVIYRRIKHFSGYMVAE
jgi:hypothetical protein